ncbi:MULTISPECIES: helix-turn-helix transcriptional regulator [unclassified Sphingobacterium]|uniref:helix-turn-helix transcriptional regulator n=1 Tax=unclassified Sphingobacterium TaxID=2609468 RepID=UPI0025DEE5D7|nr:MULTISPECIES: helix-turn-helix transcriptional regulator [unclassified Sphingobacterium]
MSLLAENLLYLRESLNLNQNDFGKLFGLTRDNVASYERGTEPKLNKLMLIVNYFHTTIENIYTLDLSKDIHKENSNIKEFSHVNKLASKMASNKAPNLEESASLNQTNPDLGRIHLEKLLNERDRVIDALNEVINTQKDLIKSQKSLIDVFRQRIEGNEDQAKNTG